MFGVLDLYKLNQPTKEPAVGQNYFIRYIIYLFEIYIARVFESTEAQGLGRLPALAHNSLSLHIQPCSTWSGAWPPHSIYKDNEGEDSAGLDKRHRAQGWYSFFFFSFLFSAPTINVRKKGQKKSKNLHFFGIW